MDVYMQAVIPLSLPDALVGYGRIYAISPCPIPEPGLQLGVARGWTCDVNAFTGYHKSPGDR